MTLQCDVNTYTLLNYKNEKRKKKLDDDDEDEITKLNATNEKQCAHRTSHSMSVVCNLFEMKPMMNSFSFHLFKRACSNHKVSTSDSLQIHWIS